MNAVGTTAHELLSRVLLSYVSEARKAHARVSASARGQKRKAGAADQGEAEADITEAVHDFRVALRRLRTMLKPARRVYGRRALREIAMVLKHYADLTGALRDEEVLHDTLAKLSVDEQLRKALDAWLSRRTKHEQTLRRKAILALGHLGQKAEAKPARAKAALLLAGAGLEETLKRLEKKLQKARKAGSMEALELGLRAIQKARAEVEEMGEVDPHDAEAMHEKRIRYKRLRYTAELFGDVLGEEGARLEKRAAKHQTRLGRVHDLDMAVLCVKRTRSFGAANKEALLKALGEARAQAVQKCLGDMPEEAPGEGS